MPLAATRPIHLLAHLVASGAWQRREDVGCLFWPDRPRKLVYSNLRNLLCKAQIAAPFVPIESTEHAIRAIAPTDLADFELAISRKDWESAVSIGAAELLQGYDSEASEAYLAWLLAMREARLEQWKHAVRCLLAQTSRPIEYREALAQSWTQRSPYDEEAVHALVALAHERHDGAQAVKLYTTFETRLMDELDVKPSHALRQLAQSATTLAHLRPDKLNAAVGAHGTGLGRVHLYGRRLELQQLATLLKDSAAQLITITGPGGVGKSDLLAGFHQNWLDAGAVNGFLIDIKSASSAADALSQVASALGLSQAQGASNTDALADALGEGRWLLMLDGADVPGLSLWLAELLKRCPNTRWLIASRQRLHLDEERLLVLDGFPMPDADETDADVLEANDGVRFLSDIMTRVGHLANTSRDAIAIAAIVRAVEGHPLALKLLGSLTHLFSLPQLLHSVQPQHESRGDLSEMPGFTELFPALIASFEKSWGCLSHTEQSVLARLAVFPADFSVAAALSVAKTQLPVVTALVDRSLLRPVGSGRLSLHAAIRFCVLAVSAEPSAGANQSYVAYYDRSMRELANLAKTRTLAPLREFVQRERAHIDTAWALAVQQRDYATLLSLQESVWFLDDGAGGAMAFSARCAEVERMTRGDPALPAAVRAMLLAATAQHLVNQRHAAAARDIGHSALREARRARHAPATLFSLYTLFFANAYLREPNAAEQLRARILALLGPIEDGVFAYWDLDFRAVQAGYREDADAAIACWEQSASVARRINDHHTEAQLLVNLAIVCHRARRTAQAMVYEEQAFATHATQAGVARDDAADAKWLCELARWHIHWGNIPRARGFVHRAEAIAGGRPNPQILRMKLEIARGEVQTAEQNLPSALSCLTPILESLTRENVPAVSGRALLAVANWLRLSEDVRACRALLAYVLTLPANYNDRKLAQLTLDDLGESATDGDAIFHVSNNTSHVAAEALQQMRNLASRPLQA